MSPSDDARARDRFAIVAGVRIGGVVLMVVGVYLLLGGRIGGARDFGAVLVAVGALGAAVLPRLLARRWRSPR